MHTHSAIDALTAMVQKYSLSAQEVDQVVVKLNQNGFNFVCLPPDKIYHPESVPEAQFSLPYTLATALVRGKVSLEDFTPAALKNPEVLEVPCRIQCRVDDELTRTTQSKVTPAILEIRSKKGQIYSMRVDDRKGSPANPMTWEEVEEKFRRCAAFAAHPPSPENIAKICAFVHEMQKHPDGTQLVKLF